MASWARVSEETCGKLLLKRMNTQRANSISWMGMPPRRRDVVPSVVAYLMLAHAIIGCCWHHAARADDNCPPACDCSTDRPAELAATCECSHHPHDLARSCEGSHCVYTKSEKKADGERVVALASFLPISLPEKPISRLSENLAVAESRSVARHLLFRVLLI